MLVMGKVLIMSGHSNGKSIKLIYYIRFSRYIREDDINLFRNSENFLLWETLAIVARLTSKFSCPYVKFTSPASPWKMLLVSNETSKIFHCFFEYEAFPIFRCRDCGERWMFRWDGKFVAGVWRNLLGFMGNVYSINKK